MHIAERYTSLTLMTNPIPQDPEKLDSQLVLQLYFGLCSCFFESNSYFTKIIIDLLSVLVYTPRFPY